MMTAFSFLGMAAALGAVAIFLSWFFTRQDGMFGPGISPAEWIILIVCFTQQGRVGAAIVVGVIVAWLVVRP